jgi:hypothetical protein
MADKNILDYPEVSVVADDDYILLDSESGGTSKILASRLTKPYEDIELQNGQLILRVYEDGTAIWYFNSYEWVDDGVGDIYIPSELWQYLPDNPNAPTGTYVAVTSSYYGDPSSPDYGQRDGWIGFRYNYPEHNRIFVMSYNIPLSSAWNGVFNGRFILGNGVRDGNLETQVTEYIAP